jgi:hypothetical protein
VRHRPCVHPSRRRRCHRPRHRPSLHRKCSSTSTTLPMQHRSW